MNDEGMLKTPSIRFRVLRRMLSLKQSTIGELINVSLSTISNWERKEVFLKPSQKATLKYVGINSQWIEYGTGEPLFLEMQKVKDNVFITLTRRNK